MSIIKIRIQSNLLKMWNTHACWLEHKMPGPLDNLWSCTHTLVKSKPFNIKYVCAKLWDFTIDHDDCNCIEHSYESNKLLKLHSQNTI